MKLLPRMTRVEAIMHGVVKIAWNDGYEGIVDLRPVIARGTVFEHVRKPENFFSVALEAYGHSIFWTDDTGAIIDLGADSLRRDAEAQAELHELLAS